ncbi:hypothetical protein NY2A_b436R [Paramecium bursaria Chlorella virus NY2A]|uniref:Uncharacterized protein b436R n=1 Tax=Paramecium bursaria Chlorella virus NY2A TaxID=46021 RepID=A7IWW1_PBCVN|nr:hypothetical protein NY2A_b436R [Paramecium bursaria Chlorella virus NY2A]ABT14835.1 hypothetical protein NY2A_b436R [Paramecium bursaria Chlorella virus NY2A]
MSFICHLTLEMFCGYHLTLEMICGCHLTLGVYHLTDLSPEVSCFCPHIIHFPDMILSYILTKIIKMRTNKHVQAIVAGRTHDGTGPRFPTTPRLYKTGLMMFSTSTRFIYMLSNYFLSKITCKPN